MKSQSTEIERVLITGGAGLVGSALTRQLSQMGLKTIVYDNFTTGRKAFVDGLSDVRTIEGDVRDDAMLLQVLSGFGISHVIHCVGDTFVPSSYVNPERFFSINVLGTLHVLRASKAAGIRKFIYVSSTEVYGSVTGPISEEHPCIPVNTYAVSKLAADRLCSTFQMEHDLPCVIVRLFNTYGPRETHPYLIPEIIRQLALSNIVQLGNINAQRDFTYVDDTARAIIACLRFVNGGDIINIGSGVAYPVRSIVNMIARAMGKEVRIEFQKERLRKHDIDSFVCDNRRLVQVTGWMPTVGIEEGIERTIHWFRSNESRWTWEDHDYDCRF